MVTSDDILKLLPGFHKYDIFTQDRLSRLVEQKIEKYEVKLSKSSFQPQQVYPKFGESLYHWLFQFPEELRLGFLAIALSIVYIDEMEFSKLLEIASEKFFESLETGYKSKNALTPLIREDIKSLLQVYAITPSHACETFIHKTQISRTKDRNKQPSRDLLESLLSTTFLSLKEIAEYGDTTPYYLYKNDAIENLIRSFIENPYIIIIEDWTLSGTTIKSDLLRLIKLLEILFTPIYHSGITIPEIFLILPIATNVAIETLENGITQNARKYLRTKPFLGYLFDQQYRWNNNIPDSIRDFRDILKYNSLHSDVKRSLLYFYDKFGQFYLNETNISSRTDFDKADFAFGYKKGSWTLVLYSNSPNNTLPPIWYPHTNSTNKDIIALFPRVEARQSHFKNNAFDIDSNMEIAVKDKNKYIRTMLKDIYKKMGYTYEFV